MKTEHQKMLEAWRKNRIERTIAQAEKLVDAMDIEIAGRNAAISVLKEDANHYREKVRG